MAGGIVGQVVVMDQVPHELVQFVLPVSAVDITGGFQGGSPVQVFSGGQVLQGLVIFFAAGEMDGMGGAIADYGRNNNTRGFSPADSLFRFVLDKGSATEGDLVLNKPRTFMAFVGDYTEWKNAWENDSKATGGDIFASTSPILTGKVEVILEKMEGRFNLADANNTLLFTAWFRCDSPYFMDGVDLTALGAVQDGDLWKVEYKLWPR